MLKLSISVLLIIVVKWLWLWLIVQNYGKCSLIFRIELPKERKSQQMTKNDNMRNRIWTSKIWPGRMAREEHINTTTSISLPTSIRSSKYLLRLLIIITVWVVSTSHPTNIIGLQRAIYNLFTQLHITTGTRQYLDEAEPIPGSLPSVRSWWPSGRADRKPTAPCNNDWLPASLHFRNAERTCFRNNARKSV